MKAMRLCDEGAATQEAFSTRMQKQCREVERYRRSVLQNEGRNLSEDEAAKEWIERYAESFARDNDPA